MADQSRTILRNLTFAWVEFLGTSDGIAFLAAAKRMGGNNLFEFLLPDPAAPDADFIPARSKKPGVLAKRVGRFWMGKVNDFRELSADVHAQQTARDESKDFAEGWILNPAVLVTDVVGPPVLGTPTHFLAVSGHGSGGLVWGGADDKGAFSINMMQVPLSFASSTTHLVGSLKCVLLASCYNVSPDLGPLWVAALRRVSRIVGDNTVGLRLVLGYRDGYPGGNLGARAMTDFLGRVRKDPTIPIVEAWRKANTRASNKTLTRTLPWAAFAFETAAGDNFADWNDNKLSPVKLTDPILHFNSSTPASGEPAIEQRAVEIRWRMGDAAKTVIDTSNRLDPKVGLFSGEKASITIKLSATVPAPNKDEIAFLVFYYYRPAKSMDLAKLIDVKTATAKDLDVVAREGLNIELQETSIQGFQLTAKTDGVRDFEIEFTLVSPISLKDGNDGTRGNITLGFFPFGTDPEGWAQIHNRILPAEFGALARNRP